MTALVDLIDDAASGTGGIEFERLGSDPVPIGELWQTAQERAPALLGLGCERVGTLLTNSQHSVEVLLSSACAGIELTSLPIPRRGADLVAYLDQLEALAQGLDLTTILVDPELVDVLALAGRTVTSLAELAAGAPGAATGRWSLVQFSSGTTGDPKGVRLDDRQIVSNIGSVLDVIGPGEGWCSCSWLPLSHDMGLVGLLLSSIVAMGRPWGGRLLSLLRPEVFVRNPSRWVEALSHHRANLTAGPDFGYALAAKTGVRSEGLDLSSLECCIVGAELVRPSTLEAFTSAFGPVGFSSTSLSPAYGMAEVGVAVSMVPPGTHWTATALDVDGKDLVPFVSCGPVLPGYECTTRPALGGEELMVRGPSLAPQYTDGTPIADPDGWFATRDRGTLVEDEVHVLSRLDEVLVVRGQNLSAPHIEHAICSRGPWSEGTVVVFQDLEGRLVVAAEEAPGHTEADQQRTITSVLVDHVGSRPDRILLLARGELPRTTSGKPRRHELRQMAT